MTALPKKVLLLYTAHTIGHQRIAENIAWWLQRSGVVVDMREVLKSHPGWWVRLFLRAHVWVYSYLPWLWRFLYLYGFWLVMMPLRLPVAYLHKAEITKLLAAVKPDLVITTQTAPSAVMSILKKNSFAGKWGIAFSDYHFHRAWVYPRADFYLTNISEQQTELEKLGVTPDKIFRMGMALPVRNQTALADNVDLRACLGISSQEKVLLVSSGSLGVRFPQHLFSLLEAVQQRLGQRQVNLRVILVCGRNAQLASSAQALAQMRPWLSVWGFYQPMAELYQVADAFLTKPGGLSVAEALSFGVPVFISHFLPGQEELNIKYLRSQNRVRLLYGLVFHEQVDVLSAELATGQLQRKLQNDETIQQWLSPRELSSLAGFLSRMFHE